MKLKCIILSLLASLSLAAVSQPVLQQEKWEWYLGEVVNDVFVGRNYFEYYYSPSAAEMEQQRSKGEVTYFLNTPEGLNLKKVQNMIDRLMASYDDIKATSSWQLTNTTCWKEFRFDNNKFRFTVKRKVLDDGTYYVSATETASYYKSLGKGKNKETEVKEKKSTTDKPNRRSTRGRRAISLDDVEEADAREADVEPLPSDTTDENVAMPAPAVSEKERRRAAREHEEAKAQEERLAKRRAQEQQREEARKQKEVEKQKKAEEKKKKEEEKRLAKEEKKRQQQQAKLEREQAAREKAAERKQASAPKAEESRFHYNDVALWLSEKYDFTQTDAGDNWCTMFSTAVKDVEMAKLAVKNALKGSNARMAIPWRVNADTQAVETGYTVDNHVLVVAIGKDAEQRTTLTITEVSNDQFELFKQKQLP